LIFANGAKRKDTLQQRSTLTSRSSSAAFNAALKQGHISVNPCAGIEPLKDKPTHKKVFSPQQVSAMIAATNGDWRGVIMVGFYCGMRLNDACNLRWRDIDLVSPIKTITYEPRKTGEQVTVAIHPASEDYLLSLPASDRKEAFLFPSVAERASVSPLSKAFRKIMERARIKKSLIREGSESGRSVYSHFVPLPAAFLLNDPREQRRRRRCQDAVNRSYNAKRSPEIYAS